MLDHYSYKLLKFACHRNSFTLQEAKSVINNRFCLRCLHFLINAGYLDYDQNSLEEYRISRSGLAAYEEKCIQHRERFITRTLSIAALVISLIALIAQLGIIQLQLC